jgi:hypothetical protein
VTGDAGADRLEFAFSRAARITSARVHRRAIMEFDVTIHRDPNALLERVCMLAQDKVVVSGDTRRGHFTGLFDGTYLLDGNRLRVTIQKKPLFVSWGLVRQGLGYLSA